MLPRRFSWELVRTAQGVRTVAVPAVAYCHSKMLGVRGEYWGPGRRMRHGSTAAAATGKTWRSSVGLHKPTSLETALLPA
jgi:hypothetical protein